jgi:hypothetical protein
VFTSFEPHLAFFRAHIRAWRGWRGRRTLWLEACSDGWGATARGGNGGEGGVEYVVSGGVWDEVIVKEGRIHSGMSLARWIRPPWGSSRVDPSTDALERGRRHHHQPHVVYPPQQQVHHFHNLYHPSTLAHERGRRHHREDRGRQRREGERERLRQWIRVAVTVLFIL